jgi:hypothetical protein
MVHQVHGNAVCSDHGFEDASGQIADKIYVGGLAQVVPARSVTWLSCTMWNPCAITGTKALVFCAGA